MGILSGLSNMGLGKLEGADVFAKEEKKREEDSAVATKAVVIDEKDFLLEKTFDCPVCNKQFKDSVVKTGKARLVRQDKDLRPVFQGIDTIKYDVTSCPNCGYSALAKYFPVIAPPQVKLVKENICRSFRKFPRTFVVSYDEAINRYRLALANAIVKKGKDSEKAYICLRMAWVVRGKAETLDKNTEGYDTIISELKDDEAELLHNALEGFISARESEHFPIAGMDETTLDYLISVLYFMGGDYDNALRMAANIITSRSANTRMKDKARDLKDEIMALKKA